MPEFNDLQSALKVSRAQGEQEQRSSLAARGQLRLAEEKLAFMRRVGSTATTNDLRQLQAEVESLRAKAGAALAVTARLAAEDLQQLGRFAELLDPRRSIGQLDSQQPILLFPVRLETRFKADPADSARPQLWLRIYPDEIGVDSFEPLLSQAEIDTARIYWRDWWAAAGVDAGHRAAWRAFAGPHGIGRARWIMQQFAPLNPGDEPVADPLVNVLIITHDTLIDPVEKLAIADYWQAVWAAAGNTAQVSDAADILRGALGEDRTIEVMEGTTPANLARRPADATMAKVIFLELPGADALELQHQAWASAPSARILPERFVVLGRMDESDELETLGIGSPVPGNLMVGPDPSADPSEQMRIENDELVMPDGMRWTADFEEAVTKGMALRIDLDAQQAARGFAEIIVLGVRLSSDIETSREALETLITRHCASRKGMEILPQGTPTNNTEEGPSGYSWAGDPDAGFDQVFASATLDDPTSGTQRCDGRQLADALGINPETTRLLPNYFEQDLYDAVAMNTALWPATLGYFLDKMVSPLIGKQDRAWTRDFFCTHVKGRGAVPAIRVGKQPYGILPVAPLHRLRWPDRTTDIQPNSVVVPPNRMQQLYNFLLRVDLDWEVMAQAATRIGAGDDPHEALLKVIALHPNSVSFYSEIAQSAEQIVNMYRFFGPFGSIVASLVAGQYSLSGIDLLDRLGIRSTNSDEPIPDILQKFFLKGPALLKGPLIDLPPLSETEGLLVARADGQNYLTWLASAARISHNALRMQAGFDNGRPPTALLYLMLRNALDVGFVDTAIDLHVQAGLLSEEAERAARAEPRFLGIQQQETFVNPWSFLYTRQEAIVGNRTIDVGDWLPSVLTTLRPWLAYQLEAIDHLALLPRSRLERAFSEHLDCCSYRLDSWWGAVLENRLETMRKSVPDVLQQGCYLGAFGIVQDLRPAASALQLASVGDGAASEINRLGDPPLQRDPANAGYMLTPSLDHAVSAAVLRNGQLAHSGSELGNTMAVDLRSERVRLALSIIEGIRGGQSLGALLGYRFERALHDRVALFLDEYILDFRQTFPLVAGKTDPDTAAPGEPIETVDARNVVDGRALVDAILESGQSAYPFGITGLPMIAETNRRAAMQQEMLKLTEVADAVGDLLLAESVHQVVRGNYDRAASTLNAAAKGDFPPIPEIATTPRSGVTLVHRMALHFESGISPDDAALITPRAQSEPAMDRWLALVLPPLADLVVQVQITERISGAVQEHVVSAADLGLAPADMLYIGALDGVQSASALDDLVLYHVKDALVPDGAALVTIAYTARVDGKISLFEAAPLIRALRDMLLRSRPLRPTDLSLQSEARKGDNAFPTVGMARLIKARDALQAARDAWLALADDGDTMLASTDHDVVAAAVQAGIDTLTDRFAERAAQLALFSIPNHGAAATLEWRRARFAELRGRAVEALVRWDAKLANFDARMASYAAFLPAALDEDRIAHLLGSERTLLTTSSSIDTADHAAFATELKSALRPAFVAARDDLAMCAAITHDLSFLHTRLADIEPAMAVHDAVGITRVDEVDKAVFQAGELTHLAREVVADLDRRLKVHAERRIAAEAAAPDKQPELAREALQAIFGEEFVIVPEFVMTPASAAELASAWADRASLLDHARNNAGHAFPVDDWLLGMARVRDKPAAFEKASMLREAFSRTEIVLTPLQLPYVAQDIWLGLEFPPVHPVTGDDLLEGERLCYTAHISGVFNPASMQVGLLLDEWTEFIPSREETAGLAFHYNRPNAEAPQSLLLAMPASTGEGNWQWDDLVDCVREAMHLARLRAVEPEQVQETPYGRFLPALVSTLTTYPLMPGLNLAYNNAIQFLEKDDE